ncbi:MAG: acyl-CoA dehydratase activase-related protein [Kiritimatiellia bacterium]|nr:acyl-CoA dehydratase activase-related protein [Kiritimatiellia bacterium]
MTCTLGIPRALVTYLHPALWETFFSKLGCEVLVSQPSTRRTIEQAGLISESEHCLPVKLFDAHLAELASRTRDLFVPRILSSLPGHLACPKLGALPDCARAQFPDHRILTVDIDERVTPLEKTLEQAGRRLRVKDAVLQQAIPDALTAMRAARTEAPAPREEGTLRFLVIGHPYNLNDAFLSQPILQKLERLGVEARKADFSRRDAPPEPIQWDTCSLIYDNLQRMNPAEWDGVIHLSSFNCGCDSIVSVLYARLLREKGLPCTTLVLDEHAGQAGVETRLEAFVDSIKDRYEHARTRH